MAQKNITRTIQYYGLLKLPEEDRKKIKYWFLTADIIRPNPTNYLNVKYQEPQTLYGYIQSFYGGRVLKTYAFKYDNQIIDNFVDTNLFLQQNISCHLEAVNRSLINLRLTLLPPTFVIQNENPIKDWRNFDIVPDQFKLKLLTSNAVAQLSFYYDTQEICSVDGSSEPPPPPPPPPPPVPPTAPDDSVPPISPPYNPPNDNGDTYKPDNGGSQTDCASGTLTVVLTYDGRPPETFVNQNWIGPVIDVGSDNGGTNFYYNGQLPGAPCEVGNPTIGVINGFLVAGIFTQAQVISWDYTQS